MREEWIGCKLVGEGMEVHMAGRVRGDLDWVEAALWR